MNEPVTKLDTRYSEPDGVVTPWEETRRVLETAQLRANLTRGMVELVSKCSKA